MSTLDLDQIREYNSLKSKKPDLGLIVFAGRAVDFTSRLSVSWQTFARMLKYILEGKYQDSSDKEHVFGLLVKILSALVGEHFVGKLVKG